MMNKTLHILSILLLLLGAAPLHAQTINGNVYGGGEMAKVEGSTNVTINDGSLGADIFGGGEGKLNNDGTVSMSADVGGSTNVTINGGEFVVAYDESKPQPYPFKQHYNIYGGGNIASQVGETHVYVTKGMVSNTSDGSTDFLDNDRFESHEAGMAQAYYHEGQMYFCVFGGGYGRNTQVTGDTWVDFNISGMTDINSTVIEDDLLEYQSYLDVIGGGFNGTIQGNTNVHVGGNAMCRNVYGGGLYATIGTQGQATKGKTNVHITGGNIDNVYGGGVMGDIMTSTNVNIGLKEASLSFDGRSHDKANDKITILMSVYGANDVSGHVPQANITHNGGTIDQNIYGAGNGDYRGYYTPNVCDYAEGENDNYFMVDHNDGIAANNGPTYKGRPQTDNVAITLGGNSVEDKAVVLGQVFGGGNSCTVGHWKQDLSSKYNGDPHQWRNDPAFFEGGGRLNITLNSHVIIGQDNENVSDEYKNADGDNVSGLFMGASGSVLATQSDAANYHHFYDATAKQYKPGFSSTDGEDSFKAYLNNIMVWSDNVRLNIPADAEDIWLANFVGGGFRGSMKRKDETGYAWSLPAGVTVGNCVIGGAYNADVHYTEGGTNLQYHGGLLCEDGTTFANVVLTLNNQMNGGEKARVFGGCFSSGTVKNTQIDYRATGAHSVYGGGALANLSGNSVVNLLGGSLTNAYGGGLGSNEVAALVNGNATTTLNGSVVKGSIFGANNINGTPLGHVKVHVLSTTPRDGQGAEDFDVPAVYGGGNLSAYEPTANDDYAEVLIENCNNSIAYVYGGGNAAPVPATQVTIKGANAIDNAFAGGNGAGDGNPGADIGYLDYTRNNPEKEYGTGTATINVQGGTIHHIYGGSNTLGYIRDQANVNVNAEGTCTMSVDELYGGGNKAPGKAGTINIICTGDGYINNVYGGANQANVTGDITLNINGGNIGNAFGGNNKSGTIDGSITVNINWATGDDACGTNSLNNVYGGGNLAPYTTPVGKVGPTVNLKNGTVSNNVYGGGYGEAAVVTGNPIVNLIGATVTGDIFGGGDAAPVTGDPLVNANYGSVKDIFAGGRGSTAVVTGNPLANVNKTDEKTLTVVDVYGGGDAANVVGTGKVQLDKGTVANIYGGGNAADVTNTDVIINGGQATMAFAGGHGDKEAEPQKEANVTNNAHLTVHGGTIERVFAGSNSKGTVTGNQLVTIVKTGEALAELHVAEVYGGGNQADGKAGTFDIGCTGSDTEGIGDLFGGAREAEITGDIAFTIEGGKIDRIFGGNNVSGNVAGSITVNIAENTTKYGCGLHAGYVYGGGQDAAYTPTTPGAYPAVNIQKGSVEHDVFGGGLGASAIVTSNPTVTISGGSIGNNVFGGGSLAETKGSPTVNISGGTVTHDVYGGGALADVTGSTTVNLTGGAVGGAYGGALGQKNGVNGATSDIAAYVNGNTTVTLKGTQITETGVFGCNNLNGTPKGHAYVHVLSTTPRDGQGAEEYDVPAVYGGGNQAAYVPSNETFTANKGFAEVLIENCDNSIAYVYGGGNAAPVPATSVTIYGANAINNAFAGGNGYGVGNPGADVGYNGYYSKTGAETPTYGTGETNIKIYGGTINNVYGGSNTLGYIRTHAYVEVLNVPDDDTEHNCELHLGEVHAGGNQAEMYCGGSVTLACSEGAEVVYAGSNDADIHGDIDLIITSGTFGKVFGGNNHSGNVYGGITISIDETGCWPVMIGELYACGNEAPYSVYGYNNDNSCKTEGDREYHDPVINLISFTRIGKVFGGGYAAAVYGSPIINVEPISGIYATGAPKPNYILNGSDERVVNTGESVTDALGADKIGSIGTIYGGGNKGAVYGNTNVLIGTKTTNKHVSGTDKTTEHEVAVTITGNVFGGGNEAIVSGDTKVTIGEEIK